MGAIDGVRAYAKCASCGMVMWTTNDTNPDPQSCVCGCGAVKIIDGVVTGPIDETFQPTTLQDLLDAEANN